MIDRLIQEISPAITALPWVDRFGGVVRTARKVSISGDIPVESAFPIASNVTNKECFEKGKYADLVPDDRYKSIVYFEQFQDINFNYDESIRAFKFNAPARVVVWLNLPKLGILEPNQGYLFELELAKILDKQEKTISDLKIKFDISINSLSHRNENIFARYSYEDKLALMLYPYDFFAINFTIKGIIPIGCIPSNTINTEIDCPTI